MCLIDTDVISELRQKGLGVIGSILLLVGGFGIMTIMLVSVTERTRDMASAWYSAPNAATCVGIF